MNFNIDQSYNFRHCLNFSLNQEFHYFENLAFIGCNASHNQFNNDCTEAIDGLTEEFANGWSYFPESTAWAIFDLENETTMSSLGLLCNPGQDTHRLVIFKISFKVGDDEWIIPKVS